MVSGIYEPRENDGASSIYIRYYTNNEDVISYDKNSIVEIKAKLDKIDFEDLVKYKVSRTTLTD